MMRWGLAVCQREFLLCWRTRTQQFEPLFFFILMWLLLPFGFSKDLSQLRVLIPSYVALMLFLSLLLHLPTLFSEEFHAGTLVFLLRSMPYPRMYCLLRVLVHSAMLLIPLEIGLAWVCFLMKIPYQPFFLSLLFATPTLFLAGSVISGLLLSTKDRGLLLMVLVLPLLLPVFILMSLVIKKGVVLGCGAQGELALLLALFLLALLGVPTLLKASLSLSLE